jgi:hypothetical protein
MSEIPPNAGLSVEEVREQLIADTCDVQTFATVIGNTPATIRAWIKLGMPALFVGKTARPIVPAARAWLEQRREATD